MRSFSNCAYPRRSYIPVQNCSILVSAKSTRRSRRFFDAQTMFQSQDQPADSAAYLTLGVMKYISLDSLPSYTKQELALHQLDRAIQLLLDEKDAISAITLGGASEEILGEMVKLRGGVSAHQALIDDCVASGRAIHNEEWKPTEFHEMFAYYRNELKHYRQGSDIFVTAECAHPVLDRAIENLRFLNLAESAQVRKYLADRWS